jgi:hypothetical protein
MIIYNTDYFIERAHSVHNFAFNYAKSIYINSNTKITITCNSCLKNFSQTPHNHLQSHGCPYCAPKNRLQNLPKTSEQFIKEAKFKFPQYNFDNTIYINNKKKIYVFCPEINHGDFMISPIDLLRGAKCQKCAQLKKNKKLSKSQENFIKDAILIHPIENFSYEKVNYVNSKTKITITCPYHGDFSQTPRDHLTGCGCPVCNFSKGELIIKAHLQKHNIKHIYQFKISDCKFINHLIFDFAVFDEHDNVKFLIEYQGRQHFKPVKNLVAKNSSHYNKNEIK